MRLVIFDIDGTLVRTGKTNQVLYERIFREEYQINLAELDWTQARFSTDSGLMPFIFEQARGRPPEPKDIAKVRRLFKNYWQEYLATVSPRQFAVPGAAKLLAMLREQSEWGLALASGGWKDLARVKLGGIGVKIDGIAGAFADDAQARTRIISLAIESARRAYKTPVFERTVYVGDAFWDVAAAARLGLAFVGVGSGETADDLRSSGASLVIRDYTDQAAFMHALGRAPVPVHRDAPLD